MKKWRGGGGNKATGPAFKNNSSCKIQITQHKSAEPNIPCSFFFFLPHLSTASESTGIMKQSQQGEPS